MPPPLSPRSNDASTPRTMSVTVERMPYGEVDARLPAAPRTSVALHLTGRCALEWSPGGRPWTGSPTRGDVTVVPAGRSGVLRVRGGPCTVLKLGIDDSAFSAWAEREERAWSGNPLIDVFTRRDPLVMQLGMAMARDCAGTLDTLYRDALANALLAHLLRRYAGAGGGSGEPVERVHPLSTPRTRRAIELMESDLTRAIGLDEIARELGQSPSHFAAQFKARLGRSPGRYLTWLRLDRARALLERGSLDVAEVARRVGYASPSHFAQAFRAEFGEPPSVWRARFATND